MAGLGVLVDVDVVIKVSSYGMSQQMLAVAAFAGTPPSMLGVTRFVAKSRLEKAKHLSTPTEALADYGELLGGMLLIEPTEQELEDAGRLERAATAANVDLDVGESQMLAVLLRRTGRLLLTGDKRAIVAIAISAEAEMQDRVACFEQLASSLVATLGVTAFRAAVCGEPRADISTTNCCSCSSTDDPALGDILQALASYVRHVRATANGILLAGNDLSALAA